MSRRVSSNGSLGKSRKKRRPQILQFRAPSRLCCCNRTRERGWSRTDVWKRSIESKSLGVGIDRGRHALQGGFRGNVVINGVLENRTIPTGAPLTQRRAGVTEPNRLTFL